MKSQTTGSFFADITAAPQDAIFKTKSDCKADTSPLKMNLGVGAYRDANGKPFPLPVVKTAEALILVDSSLNKEYLPITGHKGFTAAAAKLVFGNSVNLNNVASTQSISGTGALRLGAEFCAKFMTGRTAYFSNPTWGNHFACFKEAGVKTAKYTYWDAKNRVLAIDSLLTDLNNAPSGSIVVLHACAHNPTGVDPTQAQWKQIAQVMRKNNLFPFFDTAYQGFASGSLDQDAWSIRYFAQQGFEMIVTQSFAKNLGLYNERVGGFHVLTKSATKKTQIMSRVAKIVRPMYSNPPAHGALIVERILTSPALFAQWNKELNIMSSRIIEMRAVLKNALVNLGTPGTWNHIVTQIGMFSFTGLTPAQCEVMKSKHHVYLLNSGRISMAGINHSNVQHLAKSIDHVVRNH
jgi:aspartate/tyrosine/aromatic aminotransferase